MLTGPRSVILMLLAAAPCLHAAVSLSEVSSTVSPVAGSGTFVLTVNPAASWTAASSASWLTVSPTSGNAGATITYAWTANASTRARTAAITIAGTTFTVWQLGTTGAYNQWVNGAYGQIHTIAGGGNPATGNGDGGPATLASLNAVSVAVDANGNLFIADSGAVRRVDADTGAITTAVANVIPTGLAVDSADNLYVTDSFRCSVFRLNLQTQASSTVAGTGSCGYSGDGGSAIAATLSSPSGIALDSAGNFYIADTGNQRIRVVNAATGIINTAAGSGAGGFFGDNGPATAAYLFNPKAVAVDASGNLYIADSSNERVRRVDASTGVISTFAGGGSSSDGGPAASAGLSFPDGLAFDAKGNLYIAEGPGNDVREVNAATGIITTVAGSGGFSGTQGDGVPATSVYLGYPGQIALDSAGNLYVADGPVRYVDFATPQVTFSEPSSYVISAGGDGSIGITLTPATALWGGFSNVPWLTVNNAAGVGSGTISYSFAANNTTNARTALLMVEGQAFTLTQAGYPVTLAPASALAAPAAASGTVTLTAPSSAAWTATSDSSWLTVSPPSGTGSATLTYNFTANPSASSRGGSISILGKTLRISQAGTAGLFTPWGTGGNGIVTTIAGGGTTFVEGGPATAAQLFYPRGVAVDGTGNVYIAEGSDVRRVTAGSRTITTVAGGGSNPGDGESATAAQLNLPLGIVVDAGGNVFFADFLDNRIRRVDAQAGTISTVAGSSQGFGGDSGPAAAAHLNAPAGLAIDGAGNLYFCDSANYRVRRIDAATGIITTVAGTGVQGTGGDNGPATAAQLQGLGSAIALDSQGNLYFGVSTGTRRVDVTTGIITSLPAPSQSPVSGLAFDPSGALYAAGYAVLWRIDPASGVYTQLAGSPGTFGGGFSGDGGPVKFAVFNSINGLATDAAGGVYLADAGNSRVRYVDFTTPPVSLGASATSVAAGSGSGSATVTVPAGDPWFASSNASWLTLTASSGAGSGNIGYNIAANTSVFSRTGVINVEGQPLIVTQAGSVVTLSASRVTVPPAAGTGTAALTVTPAAAWTAQSSASWLSVSPPSGTAGTTLNYAFTANTSATARMAAITAAGRTFTVVQQGTSGSWVPWGTGSFYGQIRHFAGIAGYAASSNSGDNGPALSALISASAIATDLNGNLFIADANEHIRRIDASTGIITSVAGNGTSGFSGDGGPAAAATFLSPTAIAVDSSFNIYFADTGNNRVRRVDVTTGIIRTVAGNGLAGFAGDGGPAVMASLSKPASIAIDGAGNIFVGDSLYRVRRIDGQTGTITTVAGTGTAGFSGDGGPASAAGISGTTVAVDGAGNLYIDDFSRIRRVDAVSGIITTVAGTGSFGSGGDGGPATQAAMYNSTLLVSDAAGDLFFFDGSTNRVRRVDSVTGIIATVAGNSTANPLTGDGESALNAGLLAGPLAIDGSGNVYSGASSYGVFVPIRAIDFTTPPAQLAMSSVFAASGAGSGTVNLTSPAGTAWTATVSANWITLTTTTGSGSGAVAYSLTANNTPFQRVGVITVNGQVVTVTQAGIPASLSGPSATVTPAAGTGTVSLTTTAEWTASSSASWLTVSPGGGTGNTTLTFSFSANPNANGRIAALTIAGRTFGVVQPGTAGLFTPWGPSGQGIIQTIAGIGTSNSVTFSGDGGPAIAAAINAGAVTSDANGNVWIADVTNGRVRNVNPATGIITTVAGTGTAGSAGDGGSALTAQVAPGSIAVDISGNLYIADTSYNRIRRVDAITGNISTVAGGGLEGDGVPATQATLSMPTGLFLDAAANIYFADQATNRIRRVDAATGLITTAAGTGLAAPLGGNGPQLTAPVSVAVDPAGTMFIADHTGVRRVDTNGTITKLQSGSYYGLVLDASGKLYGTAQFAYPSYSPSVQNIDTSSGALTSIAGGSSPASASNGDGGLAVNASLSEPANTSLDGGGNFYIADFGEERVRFVDRVTPSVVLGSSMASVGAAAGTGTVSLTIAPPGSTWTANSSATWLTLAASSGTGTGSIGYSFSANLSPDPREAVIYVLGQTLTVTQAGNAVQNSTVDLTPSMTRVASIAGSGTFQLTISPAVAWTTSSSSDWLTAQPGSGDGNGTVTWAVTANPGVASRTATIIVAGMNFTVVQFGSSGDYTPWGTTFHGGIKTIAGNGSSTYSGDSGPAIQAGIGMLGTYPQYTGALPVGTAVDGNGNVFIAEWLNNRIRRVDAGTGIVTTIAGNGIPGAGGDGGPATSAELNQPVDVKLDASGNLYIADYTNNKIRRVDATTGVISTFAGNSSATFSGDGGPATSAGLAYPQGIALDRSGNLFLSDSRNDRIRRVDALTNVITTVAGNGTYGFSGDGGPANGAEISYPGGLAFDGAGNLYIADTGNGLIRRLDAVSGKISTVAGSRDAAGYPSGDNGPATSAGIADAFGVAIDRNGNLYIASGGVRRVDAVSGIITTVVGGGAPQPFAAPIGDGGPATNALLTSSGVSFDATGNLYISDYAHDRIRLVDLVSPVVTLTSSSSTVSNAGGTGTLGISVSPAGAFWSAVSSASWLTLTAGSGNGSGAIAYAYAQNASSQSRIGTITVYGQTFTLTQPGMTFAPASSSVAPLSAVVAATAGSGTFVLTASGQFPWQASSSAPWLTVTPATGNGSATLTYAFTANPQGNARIATISMAGITFGVTQTSASGSYVPWGQSGYGSLSFLGAGGGNGSQIGVDPNGNVYFSLIGSAEKIDASSGVVSTVAGTGGCCSSSGDGGLAINAQLDLVDGLALDSSGNLFLAEFFGDRVRRVDAATQIITTFAGGNAASNGDGGPATAAQLQPGTLATDSAGDLLISQTQANTIRFVNAATNIITTLAGTGNAGFSGDGGPATGAQFNNPSGTAADGRGNLFIADARNNRIRRIDASGIVTTVAGGAGSGFSGDGGPASSARLANPSAVALDPAGNLYIADTGNNVVRKVDSSSGVITTIAGGGLSGDGGPAVSASLSGPGSLAVDSAGNLYIEDSSGIHFLDLTSPQLTFVTAPASVPGAAGTGSAAFAIKPEGSPWTAVSIDSWLTVTTPSGNGNGAIAFSFTANPSSSARTGSILARGQRYTVTQDGASAGFSPSSSVVSSTAGSGSTGLSVPASMAWSAVSNAAWVTVSTTAGTGPATLIFTFTANTGAASRSATIAVLGKTFVIIQTGTSSVDVPAYTPWGTAFPGEITTIAGNGTTGFSGDGGPAVLASLNAPGGLAVDPAGNVYIADSNSSSSNYRIRKLDVTTGNISTIAGNGICCGGDGGAATQASVNPVSIALSPSGDLYFSEPATWRIRRIDAQTGIVTSVAGTGTSAYSGDGGPAAAASLINPGPIAIDAAGNIFFLDASGGVAGPKGVRRIDAVSGLISTVLGGGQSSASGIPGVSAALHAPLSLAMDGAGNLYLVDSAGSSGTQSRILRFDTTSGLVWTVISGGPANVYTGVLTVDAPGNLYLAANQTIKRIDRQTSAITTIAGYQYGTPLPAGDGGPAIAATFDTPQAMVVDLAGNLYFSADSRVRFIDFATPRVIFPPVTSLPQAAGTGSIPITTLPAGSQWSASTSAPWLTVTTVNGMGDGSIGLSFTANETAHARIATVTALGQTTNVVQAGISLTLPANSATMPAAATSGSLTLTLSPAAPWTATSSNAWLTISPASGSDSTTLTYSATVNPSSSPRMATISILGHTFKVVQLGSGGRASPWGAGINGEIDTVAGGGDSSSDGIPALTAFFAPSAVATDPNGNFYFASYDARVHRVDISTGIITTFAGGGTSSPGDGGQASQAGLSADGIGFDSAGNLFIADARNDRIRRVDGVTGIISTVAGTGTAGFGGDGGPALQATLTVSGALTLDPAGNIYFVDGNSRVRRIDQTTGIIATFAGNGTQNNAIPADGALTTQVGMQCIALASDAAGNLFCGAAGRIYRIDATAGTVTTFAGTGNSPNNGDGGPALNATISHPLGMAFDVAGNLYITDAYASNIRRVDALTGIISTAAGYIYTGFSGDGGPATSARLDFPQGAATDPAGNLYFADGSNDRIRFINFSSPGIAQTITFGIPSDATYGAAPFNLVATASSGLAVSFFSADIYVCTVNGNTVTTTGGGTCIISASQSGNAMYAAAATITQSFTVKPATQTITFGALSNQKVGTTPPALSATASSGLTVSFGSNTPAVCTVFYITITLVAPGTCSIAATQGGSSSYLPATVTQAFTVGTPQTVAFGALPAQIVGSPPFTLNASASSGLAVAFASNSTGVCTVSGAMLTLVAAGTCSITASQPGDNVTYGPAAPVTVTFIVEPSFGDVSSANESAAFITAIDDMLSKGISAGCQASPLEYCPSQDVTRGQMAVFIIRSIYGSSNFTYSPTPYFTDATPSSVGGFFPFIQKMRELGITSGCTTTTYCPNDNVTRGQMAVFIILARYGSLEFDYPATPYFSDVTTASVGGFFKYIQRMKQDNITSGCTPTTYCPDQNVTRDQMAVFLMVGGFNLAAPTTPVLRSASPATGGLGETINVTLTAANTHFVEGTTTVTAGAGITVGTVTVYSATSVTAQLTIASNATPNPVSLLVTTGTEEVVLPNGFTITSDPAAGVNAYWNGNGTTASSISNMSGTLINGATYASAASRTLGLADAQAFSLNGTSSYVQAAAGEVGTVSGARTLAAWVYPNATSGLGMPILTGGSDVFGITGTTGTCSSGGQYQLYIDDAGTCYVSDISLAPGVWSLVAVTFDGSKVVFYIDGVASVTVPAAQMSSYGLATLEIGGNTLGGSSSGASFNGLLSEVQVYNRALSPAEIQGLYAP